LAVPEGVEEENHFQEIGGTSDPRIFFEAFEDLWAHG
jgi:hypothetical protein